MYRCDETHVRSMALDAAGNLIVGTDPGGLIVRVSPSGEAFVLYQMSKSEITALAVAKDGSIYAAGVGSKEGPSSAPAPAAAPSQATPAASGGAGLQLHPAASLPASVAPSGSGVSVTGSDVYRIDPPAIRKKCGDMPRTSSTPSPSTRRDACCSVPAIKAISTLESEVLYTALITAASTQITAFQTGADGTIYAPPATSARFTRSDRGWRVKVPSKATSSTRASFRSGAGSATKPT